MLAWSDARPRTSRSPMRTGCATARPRRLLPGGAARPDHALGAATARGRRHRCRGSGSARHRPDTLRRWLTPASTALVPVEVVDNAEPAQWSVVSPSGFRIDTDSPQESPEPPQHADRLIKREAVDPEPAQRHYAASCRLRRVHDPDREPFRVAPQWGDGHTVESSLSS